MLIAMTALAGLLIGLAAALYFKRIGARSEQEKRAKALSKALAAEIATGSTATSGSGGGGLRRRRLTVVTVVGVHSEMSMIA